MNKQTMLALFAGATLWAQSAQQEFNRAVERLENKTVAGAPYSAKAITTSVQTLADGTKITRSIEAQLARDSEGRTRREQTTNAIGPWLVSTGDSERRTVKMNRSAEHVVYINDPVAQMRYVLQPDSQRAVKVAMYSREQRMAQELASRLRVETERKLKEEAERKVKLEAGGYKGYAVILGESERKAQVEDLGEQVVEGVKAKGRREKQTIPVGDIGNDRPIEVVSEVWISDELQAVVLSKHTDPRVGETEYRLTNISRAEPVRTLFEIPAGYAVKEEGREPRRE